MRYILINGDKKMNMVKKYFYVTLLLIMCWGQQSCASEIDSATQAVLTQVIRYPTQTLRKLADLRATILKTYQEKNMPYTAIEQLPSIKENPLHLIWPLSECMGGKCAQSRLSNFRPRLFFENEAARAINQQFQLNTTPLTIVAFAAGALFPTFRILNLLSPTILAQSTLVIIDPVYGILDLTQEHVQNNAVYAQHMLAAFYRWFTVHRKIPLTMDVHTSTETYLSTIGNDTQKKASIVLANDYPTRTLADLRILVEQGTAQNALLASLATISENHECCLAIIEKNEKQNKSPTHVTRLSQNAFLSLLLPNGTMTAKPTNTSPFSVRLKKSIPILE